MDFSQVNVQVVIKAYYYLLLSTLLVTDFILEMKEINNNLISWSLLSCFFHPQVRPINGSHWSDEAVDWFKAMVHNRTLYARFYPLEPTVTVELFLEKGKLGAMRYFRQKWSISAFPKCD